MPTLTFDTTTPVAPKGLGGLTRDQFADGRITFASVSLRVSSHLWMDDERRGELLKLLRERRDTIEEVCFFTSFTHSVLPYAEIARRAELLKETTTR
jgi:hypothetical protein